MSNYNMDFLSDDIQNGLLKNKRVGMKRRTIKISGGVVFDELRYLPQFKDFMVLGIKNTPKDFIIKELKGGLNKNE